MALLVALPSSAQLSFGLRAGVNAVNNDITAVSQETITSKDNYTGYFAGPMVEFQIPLIGAGIDLAVLYSQKGMTMPDKEVMKEQAIAVPLYLKYTLGLGNFLGIFAQAGAQLNYNIGDMNYFYEEKIESSTTPGEVLSQIQEYSLNKTIWSANIGAGIKLLNHLQASINYNIPITKSGAYTLYNDVKTTANENASIRERLASASQAKKEGTNAFKSSTLQFALTYIF